LRGGQTPLWSARKQGGAEEYGFLEPRQDAHGIPAFPEDSVPLKVLLDMWRSGAGAAVVLDDRGQPGGIVVLGDVLDCLLSGGPTCAPLD
jgi:CBS domain containing-hemolysin-like protein